MLERDYGRESVSGGGSVIWRMGWREGSERGNKEAVVESGRESV